MTLKSWLLSAALVTLTQGPAMAANVYRVTTTEDLDSAGPNDEISLRYAILLANATAGSDTIVVPAGTYTLTLTTGIEVGDLDITDSVLLLGAGADQTIIDAGGRSRVLDLAPSATEVIISGVTITGGHAGGDDLGAGGGGIRVGSGVSLLLSNSVVAGNISDASGGGVADSDTAPNASRLDFRQVTLRDNTAALEGGGLYASVIYADKTLALESCVIEGNKTIGPGGGIYVTSGGDLDLRHSVIARNLAARSAGLLALVSSFSVDSSAVVDNVSRSSSGGAGAYLDGPGTISNSTWSGNHPSGRTSGTGLVLGAGGLVLIAGTTLADVGSSLQTIGGGASVRVSGSLVAGGCELSSALQSDGGNVESPGNTCGFNDPSDLPLTTAGALNLGPLGDWGGPTPSRPLLVPSAAIDTYPGCLSPVVDQRGEPRPAGGGCDSGAYEVQPASFGRPCAPDATTLCIDLRPGDRRFEARAHWSTASAQGDGQVVRLASVGVDHGGLMYFFDPANPELLIKVLDGCSLTHSYWLFFSAGTNVGLTLSVRDAKTGAVRTYTNPLGTALPPVQDVAAFACDP